MGLWGNCGMNAVRAREKSASCIMYCMYVVSCHVHLEMIDKQRTVTDKNDVQIDKQVGR